MKSLLLCSVVLFRGDMMFCNPWHPILMLAVESNAVIDSRLRKLAYGGPGAFPEAILMISEKVGAAFGAATILMMGGNADSVIDHYRKHVAANAERLSDD
jgi:hypothetical protein